MSNIQSSIEILDSNVKMKKKNRHQISGLDKKEGNLFIQELQESYHNSQINFDSSKMMQGDDGRQSQISGEIDIDTKKFMNTQQFINNARKSKSQFKAPSTLTGTHFRTRSIVSAAK